MSDRARKIVVAVAVLTGIGYGLYTWDWLAGFQTAAAVFTASMLIEIGSRPEDSRE